jgi:lambda repressor-like predicted transcriptional regulator
MYGSVTNANSTSRNRTRRTREERLIEEQNYIKAQLHRKGITLRSIEKEHSLTPGAARNSLREPNR